jgi:hypothetical protein
VTTRKYLFLRPLLDAKSGEKPKQFNRNVKARPLRSILSVESENDITRPRIFASFGRSAF